MNKKGIKKYYPGVNGLTNTAPQPGQGKGYGVLAPQPEDPNKFSIGKMLFPEQKTLGKIVDNKVPAAGSTPPAAKGPSFGDKAGAFMGNYGGAITSAASSLMPLLMKKPDPNAKPYKKGSKLIKYQEGTQKTIVADPNDPDNLHEYFKRRSKEAKALREASEPQGEMGPTRKEVADFMRKYNADNKNNPNIIGSIDEDEFNARAQQLQDLGISEPIKKSTPPSLIPSKQVSFKLPQQALPTPKLNKVAIDKPSRRERKAEDKRLETLARAPITYSENTFAGPSDEELKTGKAKQDAEAKQDKQLKDSFQSDVLGKTIPKSKTVSTEKNPIPYKEKKNLVTYNRGDFNTFSAADKKKYRENIAKGIAFSIGDRKYAAAKPEEIAFSKRMEAKSKGGNKPLVKKDSSTKKEDLLKNKNNPVQGQELVRMSRMGKDNFYTPGGLPIPIKRNYPEPEKKPNPKRPPALVSDAKPYPGGRIFKSIMSVLLKKEPSSAERKAFQELQAKKALVNKNSNK